MNPFQFNIVCARLRVNRMAFHARPLYIYIRIVTIASLCVHIVKAIQLKCLMKLCVPFGELYLRFVGCGVVWGWVSLN